MADNDIINFYKKADTDNKPEEPLKEQKETPEPVVSESVSIPVPESNDPFDKFLFNLAEKLKTEKKITEQQQQQFNKRVIQPTTNPEDPFAKFLESFAGLVKQDENINKEENIKEATIDFINKLKNDDFFDYKKEEPKEEVKPEPKVRSKKYLPPKFAKKIEKVEEELPVIEQSTEPETKPQEQEASNPYLKELQSTDKKKSKVEDKISGLSDIKKIIAQQVQEQISKYPNLGFTGGGGGTNAVQYAEGGTMNGNLTVNGTVNASTYLSGGTNLLNILSSSGGGGGFADRFVSGPSQFILDTDGKLHPLDNQLLTLQSESSALSAYTRIVLSPYGFFAYDNNSNSITFDSVTDDIVITSQDLYEWTFSSEGKFVGPSGTLSVSGNVDVTNKFLSGGVDLKDIFLTSETDSQTLTFTESAAQLTISNGNAVSLSSLQSNYIYTNISQNILSNRRYAFDTSSSSLTATLPTSPQIGDEIEFFDITGYWFINNLVIANNGNYIEQKFETLECDVKFGCIQLVYVGPIDNIGWRIIPKPRHSVPSIISPIISISSDISLGYDPVTINFTGVNNLNSIVAPVDNWYWNLTGGNTPDYFTQNVSYNYSTPGVYTVNLTGSNAVGIGTASKTITALPMLVPVPAITTAQPLTGYVPYTITLSGNNTLPISSSPVANWYWNLTGGNTADYTTQVVTHTYNSEGTYTVNLTASNASGFGTAVQSITAILSAAPVDVYSDYVTLLLHFNP